MGSDSRLARLLAVVLLAAATLPGCYDGNAIAFRDAVIIGRDHVTAIAVSGAATVIEVGSGLQLTATGTTTTGTVDLTGDVTWTSSDPAAVTVDASGHVAGIANGTATVTATIGQFTASVSITASNATLGTITVSGPANIDECASAGYTASGHYSDGTDRDITSLVTWSVTDGTVARMSALAVDRNLLISKLAGTTGVVASRNGVDSPAYSVTVADDLTAIDVTPNTPPQLKQGDTQQFTATGTWGATTGNISRATTWTVTNTDTTAATIASVLNGDVSPGLVTADNGGTGTLGGTCGGLSDSVGLTVVYLSSLAITNTQPITIAPNATVLLVLQGTYSDASTKPLNESATWSVSLVSGTVVTVSNTAGTRGQVTAGASAGISTVTAKVDGKTVSVTVSVQ